MLKVKIFDQDMVKLETEINNFLHEISNEWVAIKTTLKKVIISYEVEEEETNGKENK